MKVTRKKQIFLISLLLILLPAWAASQTITVRGTVKDSKGEALIGVSVFEAGSAKNGTITDINGNFSLKVSPTAKLNVSYVGYDKISVNVDGRTTLSVVLEETAKSLNEVVVVGYGKMKRTDLTGSISSVGSEAISKSVVTSLDQVLQGRAAGVQVSQNSGEPGGGVSVHIRGISSLSGSNEPIYVVDGIIIDGGSGTTSTNPLASINPNDIVSMDILKDASATAIYGSRAANGVIQITTKRGKSGESRISYSGYVGVQEMPKKLSLLNLQQYATMKNAQAAAGVVQANNNFVRPDLLGEGTDWQDELFSQALMSSHNLSVSGGTDKSTYAFNLGYLDQNGIAVGSGFKRYTLRGNIDTQVKEMVEGRVGFQFL
ncbi:MAG: SusC/RagA family TonB-linked outer membrane protein [Paludibacter sp.]